MSDTLDLAEARRLHAEAEAKLRQATEKEQRAEYLIGQAEHRDRTSEAREKSIAERERWLAQHDETKVRAIVAAADKKSADADALMASVDKERHAAAININQLIEHDKRELAAAGIEY